VLNPHDDGISLDVLVDWLTEATTKSRGSTAMHSLRQRSQAGRAPTEWSREAVQVGTDGDIPHLQSALIRKYAADLRALGLV
jgi:fatty acid CoA ligase FadD9